MFNKWARLVDVWCTLISLSFYLFQNNFATLGPQNGFCSAWKDFSLRPWTWVNCKLTTSWHQNSEPTSCAVCHFYGRERIGESNYYDSQGEFWPKLKQCLTDWTKEALPQSFRTRVFWLFPAFVLRHFHIAARRHLVPFLIGNFPPGKYPWT